LRGQNHEEQREEGIQCNGGVDAAAPFHSCIAGPVMM
jgi:hypothetical protein